ncbi:DsbC family protein [Marinobacter mobilis]|uniref:Thiol:disulfide interchange protein n=2 Tax=Marinobacter mobilis TaxID=488533 RepID=A0A1H3A6K6_9GAMM|nr:thiol:disulfide interchange protein DsbC [Marinobacter mobilis]
MSRMKKMTRGFVSLAVMSLLPVSGLALAGETEDAIAEKLSRSLPALGDVTVRPTAASGLYEVVTAKGERVYTTEGGDFLLTGDMLQLTSGGLVNVTEAARSAERVSLLDEFGADGVISFPANGEQKAVISVFTDIDCPYCRKLHNEVPRLNELGITVHYYGFPRSGPGTPSFVKYESVWCADDSMAAMDAAKGGRAVETLSCENPVEAQYRLGHEVGVTGTPAIILEDGKMVRGYMPADQLAQGMGLL